MKIMLDAGHGYSTPGKCSPDGMKEYEFNRATVQYMNVLLQEYANVTVYYAHSDSRDVPLNERTNQANSLNVDCYVSIHANASGNGDWNDAEGIETYVYNTKPKEAFTLANRIQKRITSLTGAKSRGVKTADFHVLRATKMTAVLVECGFMTSRTDVKLLRSEYYRKKCAQAIVDALAAHYSLKKKAQPVTQSINSLCIAPPNVYRVQIGAFADKRNAENLVTHLNELGFKPIIISE